MIRFVDVRNQGLGYRFAFFTTITDEFIHIEGFQVFDSFKEVQELCRGHHDLWNRLRGLMPDWTKDELEDDVDAWFDSD